MGTSEASETTAIPIIPAAGDSGAPGPIDLDYLPHLPPKTDYRIGCVGAGFIMRDAHLEAYARAGFRVAAIASRTPAHAQAVADARGIPRVYDTYQQLLADPAIEIVDIAYPPDEQLAVVREAAKHRDHIRGILAQKPLAPDLPTGRQIVDICAEAGITLGVNQNMRYDQSIRALKTLLDRGVIGEPIIAMIDMHTPLDWENFLRDAERLILLNMSVHHIDAFRYLFGDPTSVLASARPIPGSIYKGADGIALYTLEYASGFRASAWDNPHTWSNDRGISWRVEGTAGIARGKIGWPTFEPSTIDYCRRAEPSVWYQPRWTECWFPDAFAGTMGQLMRAIQEGTAPEISGRDNLRTLAVIEAAYRSIAERRTVDLTEISG